MDDTVFTHTDERNSEQPRLAPVMKDTPLSALKERLSTKVRRPELLLEVPERPGVFLIIDPNISAKEELKAWRTEAGDGKKQGMDMALFATIVIARKTVGIVIDEEEQFDENNFPVTFATPAIRDFLNVDGVDEEFFRPYPQAVKAMYGLDPHVQSAAEAILEAAGYGDDVKTAENPTTNS